MDQWNIDYVMIDRGRSVDSIGVFRDIAFVKPAPTMLSHYRAMPARQYRSSDMAQRLQMTIANLYSSPIASYYSYNILDSNGTILYTYDGGYQNAPAQGYQTEAMHATPPVGYAFEVSDNKRTYTIVHNAREGASGDDHKQNDTVRYQQVFSNYYAYDDGTAENGYGLTSTADTVSLAYRFDLNVADTLSAIDIAFNRTFEGANENILFYLTVWTAEAGRPGTIIYRDSETRRPLLPDSAALDGKQGAFHRYVLDYSVVVNGSIFVGLKQVGNEFINIGFDRSFNSADRIYHRTAMDWEQSILSGSLMLRPCFGQAATIGIDTLEHPTSQVTLYPNPADRQVTIDGIDAESLVTVYDMQGRRMLTAKGNTIATADLSDGMYIMKIVTRAGSLHTKKLIIRH